jgi:GNAT superfamily N-acetyltransferase
MRPRSRYRIKHVDARDSDVHEDLVEMHQHKDIFLGDELPDFAENLCWIVYLDDAAVGFVSIAPSKVYKGYMYLDRIGCYREHRGNGLANRMMAVVERWCKRHGKKGIVSYSINNPGSAIAFMKRGYRNFRPKPQDGQWGTIRIDDAVYWRKRL